MDIAKDIILMSKELQKNEEISITSQITIQSRNAIHSDYLEFKIFNKEKTIKLCISGFENNENDAFVDSKVLEKVHHEIYKNNFEFLNSICLEYFTELIRDLLNLFELNDYPFTNVSMENDVTSSNDVCIFGTTHDVTKQWNNYIDKADNYLFLTEVGLKELFQDVWKYIQIASSITGIDTKIKKADEE